MLILEKVFKDEYETLLTHKDFPLKDSDAVVLALWDGLYFVACLVIFDMERIYKV